MSPARFFFRALVALPLPGDSRNGRQFRAAVFDAAALCWLLAAVRHFWPALFA